MFTDAFAWATKGMDFQKLWSDFEALNYTPPNPP
jgi:hypothetical protein